MLGQQICVDTKITNIMEGNCWFYIMHAQNKLEGAVHKPSAYNNSRREDQKADRRRRQLSRPSEELHGVDQQQQREETLRPEFGGEPRAAESQTPAAGPLSL